MIPQVSPRHPLRHELEGIERNPDEGYDMGVAQVFPYHGLLAK